MQICTTNPKLYRYASQNLLEKRLLYGESSAKRPPLWKISISNQSSPNDIHDSSSQQTATQVPQKNDTNAPPTQPHSNPHPNNASTSTKKDATPVASYHNLHPEVVQETQVTSDPKEKCPSMPSTHDSSPSNHLIIQLCFTMSGLEAQLIVLEMTWEHFISKSYLTIKRTKWKKIPTWMMRVLLQL